MMDEYSRFRQCNMRRFAELERLEAELQELKDGQTLTTRRSGEALIYKTYELPQQQQQSAGMDEQTAAAWNLWADRKIENALYEFARGINRALDDLADELGKELDKDAAHFKQKLAEQRKEFEDELAALRVADAITRSLIGPKNVLPFDRGDDGVIRKVCSFESDLEGEAATVVELKRSDVA